MSEFSIGPSQHPFSRRVFLAAVAASLNVPSMCEADSSLLTHNEDPSVSLWHDWFEAHQELHRAVFRQQRLEAQLFSRLGSRSRVPKEMWEAAEEENGYRAAKNDEFLAAEIDEKCAEKLWLTPARSVTGAAMKLHAILATGEPSIESDEFPWPQVRSVLGDLIRIIDSGGFLDPAAVA
ncbi:hypothetical protein [Rhizobium sp.]|uniref:hypothetical protein n=1 Tax=Rhizobium sp. TaxID=391 RepID=UPI0028AF67E6